jgi:DNA-binding NarL/FixJ family response regulator
MELAADAARSAVSALEKALTEDLHLEILLPVATVLTAAGSEEERSSIRQHVQVVLATIAQRTLDEDVRVRWFRGSIARRLAALAGPLGPATGDGAKDREAAAAAFAEEEVTLLRLLTEGRTNAEIAKELALAEDVVVRRLAEIFAKIGASSRAEATTFAFHVV